MLLSYTSNLCEEKWPKHMQDQQVWKTINYAWNQKSV